MRILVTGASGWIGANLVRGFEEAGHDVVAIVRPNSPRASKLDAFRCRTKFVDIKDHELLKQQVDTCDVILHNGAVWEFNEIVGSTVALLEAARDRCPSLQRFIFISSTAVYENTSYYLYRPFNPFLEEEADWRLDSSYGVGKISAEACVRLFYLMHGMPTVSFRFPAVMGGKSLIDQGSYFHTATWMKSSQGREAEEWTRTRQELEALQRDGKELCIPINPTGEPWKRHWADVRDCVRACILAVDADRINGESINVMSEPLKWDVAVRKLASLSGLDYGEVNWPDPYFYEFSLKRAELLLGYAPAYNSESMIEDAWRHAQGEDVGIVEP